MLSMENGFNEGSMFYFEASALETWRHHYPILGSIGIVINKITQQSPAVYCVFIAGEITTLHQIHMKKI